MTELFYNKYRISSTRLQTWNYGNEGIYFITICTANHDCYFGHDRNDCRDAMHRVSTIPIPTGASTGPIIELTEIGKIAETEWVKSIELRPDMNLEFGEFVVMPNHFHGIIMIGANEFNNERTHKSQNKFGPQSKNLASVIRGYKSAVTTYARKNNIVFAWQPRFHDHVIQSMDEYSRISEYIRNNPTKWVEDRFYR